MIENTMMNNVLTRSLNWFRFSGIMKPEDGFWGVAERLYLCGNPELRKQVFDTFNSFTEYNGWSVIESRRADCNFQTALLFLTAADVYGEKEYRRIGENLLEYLYCRSGLLNRGGSDGADPGMDGVWNWSHTEWRMKIWMDDNSWALAVPLIIAARDPGLAARYSMMEWADKLAARLYTGFKRTFLASLGKPDADMADPEKQWFGRPLLPHWGGLCCFALSLAVRAGLDRNGEYREMIRRYHDYLEHGDGTGDKLNVSELAYALIASAAAAKMQMESDSSAGNKYLELALGFADRILAKADPETGNVPAEHYEAPKGAHLVDTIYTANWVLLGFQNLMQVLPSGDVGEKYRKLYRKLLKLFAEIQDDSPEKQFNGCWRGMFDTKTGTWGGGDSYEGGAGSIYSGWTNAPIALAFAGELLGTSLIGQSE